MQLTTSTVMAITGASQRQLAYWDKTGLLKPSAKATGYRRYTFPDVVAAETIVALRRQGCSLQKVRRAVAHLRKHYPEHVGMDVLSSLTLLTDGKHVYMLSDGAKIMEVVSKQTVLWIVNLGRLISEVQRRTETLALEWIEAVKVGNQSYRLRVSHDPDSGGYVAQCVELPGAIEQGDTAAEAIANGVAAVESVRAFLAKRAAGRVRRRA